jgi:hypothetical protein
MIMTTSEVALVEEKSHLHSRYGCKYTSIRDVQMSVYLTRTNGKSSINPATSLARLQLQLQLSGPLVSAVQDSC